MLKALLVVSKGQRHDAIHKHVKCLFVSNTNQCYFLRVSNNFPFILEEDYNGVVSGRLWVGAHI